MAMTPEEQKKYDDLQAEIERLKTAGLSTEQFKSEIEDLKSKFTEQTQLNSKLNTMLDTLIKASEKKTPPASSKAPDPLEDPEAYQKWVSDKTKEEIKAVEDQKVQAEEIKKQQEAVKAQFYAKYPHLSDHQPVVEYFARQLAIENPSGSLEDVFKEVAKRTEEYVTKQYGAEALKKAPAPPHVGAGGDPSKTKTSDEPLKYDVEASTDDAIKDMKAKQTGASATPPRIK